MKLIANKSFVVWPINALFFTNVAVVHDRIFFTSGLSSIPPILRKMSEEPADAPLAMNAPSTFVPLFSYYRQDAVLRPRLVDAPVVRPASTYKETRASNGTCAIDARIFSELAI